MNTQISNGDIKSYATTFIAIHSNDFPHQSLPHIFQHLEDMPEERAQALMMTPFKSPTLALVLSVLLGILGIDRFYIGDFGLGIAKLITGGGCGIWWLVDLFLISNATKRQNYKNLYFLSSQLEYLDSSEE